MILRAHCVIGSIENDCDVPPRSVVADRVLHDVAEGLLEQSEVAPKLDGTLGHGKLEGDLLSLRNRSMPIDDTFGEPVQVDRIFVRQPLAGFEACSGVEIMEKGAKVLRLLDAWHDGQRVECFAGLDSLLERDEVTLQHAQRKHHIVRGVGDVVAERSLPLAERSELCVDRLATLLESSAELRDLVAALDANRLFGITSEPSDRFGELSDAANDRTRSKKRDDDHDQRDEKRRHQNCT